MRVMGVDPGLTRCGIGVVQGAPGRQVSLVHVSVVRTPSAAELPARLVLLESALEEAVSTFHPDVVAVERVFSQQNVRTVMGTAQAAAVAALVAGRHGLPVALHTPSEVKAAVTGSGRAGKEQVTTMVTRLLRLDASPRPADAADALALALCHLWRGNAATTLAALAAAAPPSRVPASIRGRHPAGRRRDQAGPAGAVAGGTAATAAPGSAASPGPGDALGSAHVPGRFVGIGAADAVGAAGMDAASSGAAAASSLGSGRNRLRVVAGVRVAGSGR